MRAQLQLTPILVLSTLVVGACGTIEVNPPVEDTAVADTAAEDAGAEVKSCSPGDNAACDDGNSCTIDKCNGVGECLNTPKVDVCSLGVECFEAGDLAPGNTCSVCQLGASNTFVPVVCDDENPCTDNQCDAATGCNYPTNDSLTCDDGDDCSSDDHCTAGACEGTCACKVDDDCSGETLGTCEKAVCLDNACSVVADADADGSACTGDDPCLEDTVCNAGACGGGTAKDCSGAADDCNIGVCNAASGECQPQPVTDGFPCDETNECSTASCQAGTCDVVPNLLQDCTHPDSCVVGAKCTATAECKGTFDSSLSGCNCNEASECDDGISCTSELCTAGECIYELQFDACLVGGACSTEGGVNPENPCESCNTAVSQSAWTLVTCPDDSDDCTIENCNSTTGACESLVAPGANCDDGVPCTDSDLCDTAGACSGSAKDCDDGNPCTTDSCETASGDCIHTITDGVACDAACVVGGVCTAAGVCSGTTLDCDDSNPCTLDTCDVSGGSCLNTPEVGKDCVADTDACTTDRCNSAGSCAAQTIIPDCTLYSTEFDCTAGDWSFAIDSGAVSWALDNTVNPPGFYSANCSLNFNNDYDLTPNYHSPFVRSAGTATGPAFDASDAQSLWVNFYQYWDFQDTPGIGFDIPSLHVSTDGFETFTTFSDVGHRPQNRNTWFIQSIDISQFAGESNVQLRFHFDTVDAGGNNGAGWFIDDLTVSPAKATVPPENCGNTTDDDLDGLIDCDDPDCFGVCAKPADTCPTASPLGNAPTTVTGTFATLSDTAPSFFQCSNGALFSYGGTDALFTYTPTASGNYRFILGTIGAFPSIAVVTDCATAASSCIAGTQVEFGQTATLTVPLEGGTTYTLIAGAGTTAAGPFALGVQLAAESDCDDGTDNDGDGGTDCLDIECANASHCLPEVKCGDGIDDDGDGDTDCADSDCSCIENDCTDGMDNDLDGATDCDDTDCGSSCLEGAKCADGIDNDNDGFTDCADVGDCGAAAPCLEQGNCADGVDNDNDGDFDCDDSDCTAVECDESTQCNDGLDNDGDNLVDCADADCESSPACLETDNCNDYIDNDGDGAVDCDDSQCVGNFACTEVCYDGVDNDKDGQIDCSDSDCSCTETFSQCHDGKDNDLDGSPDCADSDCSEACSESYSNQCINGVDDDGNGDTDCDDAACNGNPYCQETNNCFDGKDNDGNGAIDCADAAACGGEVSCREDVNCSDGKDNDKNGLYDCQDPQCLTQPSCGNTCNADQDCDDGNTCTFDDCSFGICKFTAIPNCCNADAQCDDGNACTTSACSSEGGGLCESTPVPPTGAPNVIAYDFETPVAGLNLSNSAGSCGWQLVDLGTAVSGDQVLYYGDPGVGNYACGGANGGTATTEEVTIPVGAFIGFHAIIATENGSSYDRLTLEFVEGGVATVVWEKSQSTTNWLFISVDAATVLNAGGETIVGRTGQFRFTFETVDDLGNETLGVLIDDFTVGDPCQ